MMFKNIQGENENRLINANGNGNLKMSVSETQPFPFHCNSIILDFDIINSRQIILTIENDWKNFIGYNDSYMVPNYYLPGYLIKNSTTDYPFGKLIHEFDYLRIYSNDDWLNLKIINVKGDYNETIVTCLLEDGDFENIKIGDTVKWSFPINREIPNHPKPSDLLATNITNNSVDIEWEKSSLRNEELVFQVSWKKTGNYNWEYSPIGNWVTGINIELEGSDWAQPKETFNGKPAYWVEFVHKNKIENYQVAIGRLAINEDGNFSEFTLLNKGSGYIDKPNIKLYHRDPQVHSIKNIKYSRPNSTLDLKIDYLNHPFSIGDIVEISNGRLNGDWEVINITGNDFTLQSLDNIEIPVSATVFNSGMNLKIKPIENNIRPGRIIPILNLNKYNIDGLDNNTNYEIRVVSYYNRELTKYSSYTKSLKVKTR